MFCFLISGHTLQKVVEINLNKQNRFAENKTRTPKLLQSNSLHKALLSASVALRLGKQHPACTRLVSRGLARMVLSEARAEMWLGMEGALSFGAADQMGHDLESQSTAGGGGMQTSWEHFSHRPFPTGDGVLGNGHGNPHPLFGVPEALHPLARLLPQRRTEPH